MHLTNAEFQALRASFHCTAWPDEVSRVPIEVEGHAGGPPWVAYVPGDQVEAVWDWLQQERARPSLRAVPGAPEQAPGRDAVPPAIRKAA